MPGNRSGYVQVSDKKRYSVPTISFGFQFDVPIAPSLGLVLDQVRQFLIHFVAIWLKTRTSLGSLRLLQQAIRKDSWTIGLEWIRSKLSLMRFVFSASSGFYEALWSIENLRQDRNDLKTTSKWAFSGNEVTCKKSWSYLGKLLFEMNLGLHFRSWKWFLFLAVSRPAFSFLG